MNSTETHTLTNEQKVNLRGNRQENDYKSSCDDKHFKKHSNIQFYGQSRIAQICIILFCIFFMILLLVNTPQINSMDELLRRKYLKPVIYQYHCPPPVTLRSL